MLRWQTAGESHGEALVAMIEGLPAGIHVTTEDIVGALARRRLGYGRGARMKFEQDKVRMLTGVRFGETIGSPVAIEIANELAPEHLELCIADPMQYLPQIRNAGSVFLGRYCPEALGDYMAGPNHTLPTSGTARFSSPLSVDDFIKKTQYTYFTQDALAALCGDVATFARAEGLEAHARSALIRSGEVEK